MTEPAMSPIFRRETPVHEGVYRVCIGLSTGYKYWCKKPVGLVLGQNRHWSYLASTPDGAFKRRHTPGEDPCNWQGLAKPSKP